MKKSNLSKTAKRWQVRLLIALAITAAALILLCLIGNRDAKIMGLAIFGFVAYVAALGAFLKSLDNNPEQKETHKTTKPIS